MKNSRQIFCIMLVLCLIIGMIPLHSHAEETCTHSFDQYGNCTLCTYICPHQWDDNGWCQLCGNDCGHDFVDQVCTICGIHCPHNWQDSTCTLCGGECEHSFVDGLCTNCGYADPDYVPAETTTATLVTDASTLYAGDQIVIVAAGSDFALGTTQNTNNRGQGAVTKDGNVVTFDATAVQIITLAPGAVNKTFALTVDGAYLYAPSSSSNYLKTSASLTENGSWSIAIDAATGVAAIAASGTSTRNVLRYNSASGLFSCYAASNSQKDVAIYRIGEAQEHVHSYDAMVTAPTCEDPGYTTYTCFCGHSYVGDEVAALGHSYADGICGACGAADPDYVAPVIEYYLVGYINGANYGCEEDYENLGEYRFVDGQVIATFNQTSYVFVKTGDNAGWYMTNGWLGEVNSATLYTTDITGTNSNKLYVPGGVEVTFTLVENADGTLTLSYVTAHIHSYEAVVTAPTCEASGYTTYTCACGDSYVGDEVAALGHSYNAVVTAPTCEAPGYTTYTCPCGHSYVGDEVAALGHSYNAVVTAPTCEDPGYTTYTCFCGHSYVGDEVAALGHSYDAMVTAPTCEDPGYTTYTCFCGHSYVGDEVAATGHSYSDGVCTKCGAVDSSEGESDPIVAPILKGASFSLSFESEILVNFYYTVSDMSEVVEQGMLVFYTNPASADISAANDVYSGSLANGSLFVNTTKGIAAKYMGDYRYYAAYVKLTDGTYAYSPLYQYSPKKYATNMLSKDSTSAGQKALCVAMLNYGAAAQKYFGYRTDDLMNKDLTAEQQALVIPYEASLFKGAIAADSAKTANFPKSADAFSGRSATVSFEGAFSINYYFSPSKTVAGEMTMYYWSPEAYAAAAELTTANASGSITMVASGDGSYWGQVSGIAAKYLDETYYVAGVYTDASGNTYCTGIIAYSLSRYCINNAKDGNAMQELAANTAMYGYYAKLYFTK